MNAFSLRGKVALVTGASRGLGQGMVLGLAEAGADIAVIDIAPNSDDTSTQVEAIGRRFMYLRADLLAADAKTLHDYIAQIIETYGRLDILVNNAGIIRRAPAMEFGEQDWNDVVGLNLTTVFFLSQAAAQVMREQGGGKIINIASMLSFQGGILVPSYTASKSAVAGLTRALANEWSAMNINVNAIAPGYMATEATSALRADPTRNQAILERIPAGRWGKPADLKGAVVFLASEAAHYVHGIVLPVDGGWLAR